MQLTEHKSGGWIARLSVAQQISLIVGVAVLALVTVLILSLVRVQHLGTTVEALPTTR